MKKLLLSFTLLVYFLVSTGFVLSVHYCMDRMQSIQLGDSHRDHCNVCGMPIEEGKGCCKEDVKIVKMQIDQVLNSTAKNLVQVPVLLSTVAPAYLSLLPKRPSNCLAIAHAPPMNRQDSYLRHRVFRL